MYKKNAVKRIQNFFILLRVHKVGVKYVHIIHKTSCFQKQQLLNRFEYPFLFFLTLKIFLASSTAFGPLVILLDVQTNSHVRKLIYYLANGTLRSKTSIY